MKPNQMSDGERKIYDWLVNETKAERKRYHCKAVIGSIMIFLVGLGLIVWYWQLPAVSYSTSLSIGGIFYALSGALLLARGAVSSPATLGLVSMTRLDGNPKLFAELMKSRLSALLGISFLVGAFVIQSLGMILFGN